ncbi:Amino Acid-Polyamine-Organocation (APC) Family [Achlya hypogyna]|uniref:Amino Acid-Polyamine-Organocation (APC) Family n=1 Tax=Achlya hypogyna TaxID=1202772 RepID=A0A1V9ZJ08_ACHHY|nr:Amino Acid-Polyamine-Organocation (APC) Family [Achlya hypogyna]
MPRLRDIVACVIHGHKSTSVKIKVGSKVGPTTNDKQVETRVEEVAVKEIDPEDRANTIHVCSLGIVCVMGGQYYGWNAAFATGFAPFAVSQIVMGCAYVVYMSCAAEICGKIAFSGGSYGLSRVTLGFYLGYMVGFLELLEYTACTSVSLLYVSRFVTVEFDLDQRLEPLIWLVYFVFVTSFFQLRGKIMWNFMVLLAVVCAVPAILFIFGALKFANLPKYGYYLDVDNKTRIWASGTMGSAYFAWLPYTTWAFAGVECLSLVTDMTVEPKVTIPRGMLSAVWVLFLFDVSLICLVPALAPGIATATKADYLLNQGFAMAYGISDSLGAWLILPAQFGMAAGFTIPSARLVQALADSTLLPEWMGLKATGKGSMWKSLVFSAACSFVLCVLGYLSSDFSSALQDVFILAASFCYTAQIVGFILLRTTYKAASDGYMSPYGIPGAVAAISVYGLLALSIIGGFQGDHGVAICAMLVFVGILTAYYYWACKDRQTISKDEYASIFRFTIIKFNNIKKKAARNAKRKAIEKAKSSFLKRLLKVHPTTTTSQKSAQIGYNDVGISKTKRR